MASKIQQHFDPPSSASSESGAENEDHVFSNDISEIQDKPHFYTVNIQPSPSPIQRTSSLSKSPHSKRPRTTSTSLSTKKTSKESVICSQFRTIYTAGRPPWYNCYGNKHVEPFVIGICGGSASGKTTVAAKIIESLDVPWVTLLSMDSFYKVLNEKQHEQAACNEYNFDHPDAFDSELLIETLQRLKDGKKVEVPIYNFVTHSREHRTKTMYGANVIIFEGILAFYFQPVLENVQNACQKAFFNYVALYVDPQSPVISEKILADQMKAGASSDNYLQNGLMFAQDTRSGKSSEFAMNTDMLDMKVFVDTDADVRLARRLKRDISQRGRDLEGVLKQYMTMVKPSFYYYIAPSMVHADIIVPRGGENTVAIELIVHHVHTQLQARGFKLREKLAHSSIGQPLPKSLHLLPSTPQIRGLHTFIRNKDTPRDEFIFYSKRLIRLVIEFSLSLLPFEEVVVETPQGGNYQGKRCASTKICGVSILRAGETMEQAVRDVCKDIRIGKILIQTNHETDEPELYYLRLPKDIKDYKVILMDATVATGAAAIMAIRVLLDHDVPEENILLASLLMAEIGVQSVAYAFPQVKMVTSALDPEINDKFHVLPGIGNFGDRYFGTEPSTVEDLRN